jgi:hypothetical protein
MHRSHTHTRSGANTLPVRAASIHRSRRHIITHHCLDPRGREDGPLHHAPSSERVPSTTQHTSACAHAHTAAQTQPHRHSRTDTAAQTQRSRRGRAPAAHLYAPWARLAPSPRSLGPRRGPAPPLPHCTQSSAGGGGLTCSRPHGIASRSLSQLARASTITRTLLATHSSALSLSRSSSSLRLCARAAAVPAVPAAVPAAAPAAALAAALAAVPAVPASAAAAPRCCSALSRPALSKASRRHTSQLSFSPACLSSAAAAAVASDAAAAVASDAAAAAAAAAAASLEGQRRRPLGGTTRVCSGE